MAQVYEQVQKGNVVLVEGRLRISRLIKCATQSQADLGKQYHDRNLVHLALMLLARAVRPAEEPHDPVVPGNCTDFQRIIATLATSQLGKER